eukprot:TRINITY_DN24583_c0_g3_i1.p1 TRINITY_DN24583_c0_g3~~TRINITY_DN24583_c0_g3_i1.p1  ORF type:complete len:909 (+),score=191.46 TRINITY_DN24583_c0_g3_i1:113-2728(+)
MAAASELPPAKRPKTAGDVALEREEDAKADSRPKLRDPVTFLTEDMTVNVMPSTYGGLLVPLTNMGLQYLLAGARANVGARAGRYLFEVKVVEFVNPAEEAQARTRALGPRHLLRVGLSTANSSLLIGSTSESVCFELEGPSPPGSAVAGASASTAGASANRVAIGGDKLVRGEVLAVLVNLVPGSPNANTVSLFRNGQRVGDPQPLPEALVGKEVFPSVTFRNMTVHTNFGPSPLVELPFRCRLWQDSAQADVTVTPAVPAPKDGKYEVLFPICVPDEGTFDWLDYFLEKNRQYTELSDRMILNWAENSGVPRAKGYGPATRTSNDRPEFGFGLPLLDDMSAGRLLQLVTPLQSRSYVVMEVRGNLLREERKEAVTRWPSHSFKRIAMPLMGDPPIAYKKRIQDLILKERQEASNAEFRAKVAEAQKQRQADKRQKELERTKRQAERKKKRMEEDARRKSEGLEPLGAELDEQSEDEVDDAMDEDYGEPPKVSLTAEDKKIVFRKGAVPDLSAYNVSTSFTKFSLPDKDEGFDDVRCDWHKFDKCKAYLTGWIQEHKLTTRVEDLTPSEWFTNKLKDWQKGLASWHQKHQAFRTALQKKVEAKAAKEAEKKAKEEAAARGTEGDAAPSTAEGQAQAEEDEDDTVTVMNFDGLDVFGVEDFLDVGGGQPLFAFFNTEDWTMMSLRFELNLMVHSFRKDVNDPDRIGIHVDHLSFYYNKYFKKQLNVKFFGVDTMRELIALIRDTVVVAKNNVVEPQLPVDLESNGIYVMLTEEARRDRNRRLDLGDESARLRLLQPGQNVVSGQGVQLTGVTVPASVRPPFQQGNRPPLGGGGGGGGQQSWQQRNNSQSWQQWNTGSARVVPAWKSWAPRG